MAREILFRGKRMDNGEWVEGYYTCIGDKFHYILVGKLDIANGYPNFEHYWVNSETVGQYTGLTDKNGKKIFEGDIIRFATWDYVVKFTSGIWVIQETPKNEYWGSDGIFELYMVHSSYDDIEVIGNIYDNPELLEVQECEQQN